MFIKKENVEEFMKASFELANNTRKEPGNVRYDILRANEDGTRFFFYEMYKSQEAFVEHQKSEHFCRWEATVTGWMERPFEGAPFTPVFFGDAQC